MIFTWLTYWVAIRRARHIERVAWRLVLSGHLSLETFESVRDFRLLLQERQYKETINTW